MAWRQIGTNPARDLIVGGDPATGRPRVFATNPTSGDIYRYTGSGTDWERIGDPGAMFASTGTHLFRLNPDRRAVMRWTGGANWERVGGPAASIYAGPAGLIGTNPDTGDVYRYTGQGENWEKIGGPGATFAVGTRIAGLSPNRQAVWLWSGRGEHWDPVGGAARSIYAGTGGLYKTDPASGDISRWNGDGRPDNWGRIGGPGHAFAAASTIYGISPDRQKINGWVRNEEWEEVGPSAEAIAVWHHETEEHLYAIRPGGRTVWAQTLPTLS